MWLNYFITVIIIYGVVGTLSPRSDGKKKKNKDINVIPQNSDSDAINWKDILASHKKLVKNSVRQFEDGLVLGYVTPWNNHGYDIAKWSGSKFTHISPVWLQMNIQSGRYEVTGTHDIDLGWIKDVKKAGSATKTKVIPRILFEGWHKRDFLELIENSSRQEEAASVIIQVLKKNNLDGIVVEIWNQIPSRDLLRPLTDAVGRMATKIRDAKFTFVLVIPPPFYKKSVKGIFGPEEFNKLVDSVDAFSLMTYDYSNFQNPGPNSPIEWMRECVEYLVPDKYSIHRKKILLGLNIYGLDHSLTGGSHVLGDQYIDILSKYKPNFQYDHASAEHFFEYKTAAGRHTVFYPSLQSLQKRIKLATELGTGLSLWEIGQGLDYFYNIL